MNGKRPIRQLTLTNFLSYGSPGSPVSFLPLNVLIGPNASGKSNLIEALAVLRSTANGLSSLLRQGGGVGEYLHKSGSGNGTFSLHAVIEPDLRDFSLSLFEAELVYHISISRLGQRPDVVFEAVYDAELPMKGGVRFVPTTYYANHRGKGVKIRQRASVDAETGEDDVIRDIRHGDLSFEESVLSQRRDPDLYPELTYLAGLFGSIAIFREWSFGNRTLVRAPQPTDLPTDVLLPDAGNLALVLHDLMQRSVTRQRLLDFLRRFYGSARFISTKIEGGTVQLYLEEESEGLIPATRLSDGTLRYLSLLAILCHPTPPPIVCIEEPELGLHPDILPTIAELLLDASQRTQLIVTTHSDALVSALSDTPECIVVCEPGENGTELRRLDKEALSEWLSRYSLGELWRMGEIGGTRW